MFSKIFQYVGIFLIFLFSAASIFISTTERDINNQSIREKFSYASYFEDRFFDFRIKKTLQEKKVDSNIVLAAIDDRSLTDIGRFPWDRTVWADLLKKLKIFGAKVVSFDVFFPEPERICNNQDPDSIFAEGMADFKSVPGNEIVLSYATTEYPDEGFSELPADLYNFIMDSKQKDGINLKKYYAGKNVYIIDKLLKQSPALGHINSEQDSDGIFRHYPIVRQVDEFYFPSFGLQTYLSYTGESVTLEIHSEDSASLILKNGTLPVNFKGESKIRWLGGDKNFPVVSITDILKSPANSEKMKNILNGKIIFIASTAYGAHDFRHTPIDPMLPGIFFHMNLVHMLMNGYFYVPSSDSTTYSWTMLLASMTLLILVMLFGNPLFDLLTINVLAIGLYIYDTYWLIPQGYEIKLFFVLFSIVATYSWSTFLHFYITLKEKNKIRGTFSSFVAPAVVDQMLKNPDKVKVGGEKKEITVFFSDVRDFTSISESLTPEELSICLNQYMGMMTDIVFETYGTLDKYIGDALVAFWGAPLDVEDHAYHAIRAALKMIEKLPEINERFREQNFPEFKHGIGLNTGPCSVGNMGSDKIFSYTALGDNMNLGARLESLCKFYGVQLNVSENTIKSISAERAKEFTFRILDKVRVKGKSQAVTIYEGLHSTHPFKVDSDALNSYNRAFELYQNREFQEAITILAELNRSYPEDKSSLRILEICQTYLLSPPEKDWDGVYTHKTKG